jgi:hypothetical protein
MKRTHLVDNTLGNKNNMFLLVNSHLRGVKIGIFYSLQKYPALTLNIILFYNSLTEFECLLMC